MGLRGDSGWGRKEERGSSEEGEDEERDGVEGGDEADEEEGSSLEKSSPVMRKNVETL